MYSSKDAQKVFLKFICLQKQIKTVAFTIQRFLSLSEDKHTLASLFFPNVDSWMWSDKMKKEASQIWSLKDKVRKHKGGRLQQWFRDLLIYKLNIHPDDVESRSMGAGGFYFR